MTFQYPISASLFSQEYVVQRLFSKQEELTLKESCCLHHFIRPKSDDIKCRLEGEEISQMGGFPVHGVRT